MRPRPLLSVLLLVGCSDRVVVIPGDESTGTNGESTAAPETGDPPTSEPTTADTTGEPDTTDAPDSSSTGSSSESTGGSSSEPDEDSGTVTTGEAVTCGPPCPEGGWTHQGDLEVIWGGGTDDLTCLTRVIGRLEIQGAHDTANLHGLRNLREVEGLRIEFNDDLTDLDALSCLVEAHGSLSFYKTPALVDTAGLAGLRSADYIYFEETGLTSLPVFAPDFMGIHGVYLAGNASLVELDALAGWSHLDAVDQLSVQIDQNDALTSVAGMAALLEDAGDADIGVQILGAASLSSLAGLEGLAHGSLWLQDLPQVPDLEPLANFVDADRIALIGMPKVADLHGLHNLKHADELMIGDCVSFPFDTAMGMDGLADLSGLDALTSAWSLQIARNENLTALTGAPTLKSVNGLEVIDNPMLTQADVDALIDQLDAAPEACFGGDDQCMCFEINPW